MTEKQKRLFKKFGAEVKMVSTDGSITIETEDVIEFMRRSYGLKPVTNYRLKNQTYTVFSNLIASDDVIVVKTVYTGLYILLMPDFEIY
jgi:hypothetical protein